MGLWVTALGPMSNPGRGPRAVQHGPSPCLPRGASPGLTRSESVAGGVDPGQSPGDEPAACEPPCTPSSRLLSRQARRPPGPSQAAVTRRPSTVTARFIAAPELRDSDSTGRDASGAGRQAPDNRDPSLKLRIQVRPPALPRMQAHGTRAWQGLLGGQRASVQSARIRCGWGRGGGAPAGMAGPRGWCRGGWRLPHAHDRRDRSGPATGRASYVRRQGPGPRAANRRRCAAGEAAAARRVRREGPPAAVLCARRVMFASMRARDCARCVHARAHSCVCTCVCVRECARAPSLYRARPGCAHARGDVRRREGGQVLKRMSWCEIQTIQKATLFCGRC